MKMTFFNGRYDKNSINGGFYENGFNFRLTFTRYFCHSLHALLLDVLRRSLFTARY